MEYKLKEAERILAEIRRSEDFKYRLGNTLRAGRETDTHGNPITMEPKVILGFGFEEHPGIDPEFFKVIKFSPNLHLDRELDKIIALFVNKLYDLYVKREEKLKLELDNLFKT